MTTTSAPPQLQRPISSLRALETLREKIRAAFLIDGLVASALLAFALALGSFLLDYALILPRGVRAVLLVAGAGYLVMSIARRVIAPRRMGIGEEDLAVLVEARSPKLAQTLITAVQLSRPGHRGAAHLSGDLIAEVVRGAEASCGEIDPRRVIDLRPVRQNVFLLAAIVVALAAGSAFRPDLASIWLGRSFLLKDLSWPRNTSLELVTPTGNPVYVALGDDLPLEVKVLQGAPSRIEVEADVEGSIWRDEMVEGADGNFRKVFEDVAGPFRFRVRGGDHTIPDVEVLVRLQPTLSRLDVWYRYPDYTGLDPTPAEKPLSNPSLISVPAGTQVAMRGWCDLPLDRAYFVFEHRQEPGADGSVPAAGDRSPAAGEKPAERDAAWPAPGAAAAEVSPAAPRPPPLDPAAPPIAPPERSASMVEFSFPVEADGQFFFQLRSADGFPGRKGKTVSVRAIPDRPPTVKIVEPDRASEEVTAEATVPMEFLVRHSYGIRLMSLETVLVSSDPAAGQAKSYPLGESAPGPREAPSEVRPTFTLDLSKISGIGPELKLQYFAQADDFAGHIGRSDGHVLHIITKEDMKRILNDRLMLLRDSLREIARDEESARKDLDGYRAELAAAAPAPGREKGLSLDGTAAGRLVRNRQDQERITARLLRSVKEFEAILSKMESNRVGDEKEKSWIGGLRDEVGQFAATRSPEIVKSIEAVRTEALRTPQPPDRLSGIVDEERRLERDILLLAGRLSEFGDVNWVIQQLQDLKRRQEEIRDRTREKARGSEAGGDR
jgi:hypothetical protein